MVFRLFGLLAMGISASRLDDLERNVLANVSILAPREEPAPVVGLSAFSTLWAIYAPRKLRINLEGHKTKQGLLL